jgi:hypothetical protein
MALLLVAAGPAASLCQAVPDGDTELTRSQFRSLVAARISREKTPARRGQSQREAAPPDLKPADEGFSRLLNAQARQGAARQSLDRLSGWSKAAQARLESQSAAALDVDLLRFAETKMASELAQFEAGRRRAAQEANALLGRSPDSPLVALFPSSGSETEAFKETSKGETKEGSASQPPASPPAASRAPQPGIPADRPAVGEARRAQFENELLPQGRDLLAKMYQSYLFGGIPLTALLWQEQEVYRTELRYRLLLAGVDIEPGSPQGNP